MKKTNLILLLFTFFYVTLQAQTQEKTLVKVTTDNMNLIYQVGANGRLYQTYLGQPLKYEADIANLPLGTEAYLTHGVEDYFEPAVRILHNDGNPSLLLKYVSHAQKQIESNVTETVITLQDEIYPVTVKLFFVSFEKENIIKQYTEISHQEKKPVTLYNYASSLLHLNRNKYYLTEFAGDWAHEVNMTERQLDFGKKIIDTKLGSRANMFCSPMFMVALDKEIQENEGEVLLGTISWTGNFRFTFEVDQQNKLRVLSGINPHASEYTLQPNEVFRTPEFVFTYSMEGKGKASRDMHRWARKYQLKDGDKSRMTLLNNWEATYFNFDEEKLVSIMDEAVKLGVDMFLLDDGWFANKYPRSSDRQGLGDWQETVTKLPNGIGKLVKEATDKGIKFGLWIEPEMVNPKSELYEKHKDWVIHLPNRKEYYFRSQLVLDLSNPKVQDYVFGVVDDLMTKYPGIAYFKWDCNSPITNIYSPYLKDKQSHIYIEHVRGLYNILERVKAKYPNLPMMLCSGGGGRSDYKALEYFTEFWPSDNTDAVERIFIQWGYSHFFPSKAMAAHVTSWGKQPVKFRTDVAMMCKLGFDIRIGEMSEAEQEYCRNAVKNFKRLENVILDGDLYRLVSPYESDHASVMYVDESKDKSVLYVFDMHPRYAENVKPVRLQGLIPDAQYEVKEINLLLGARSSYGSFDGKTFSGDYLMKVGLPLLSNRHMTSHVLEITRK
ncbi:alpha-galactosidase [Parabacteroides sp. 52]|uniref:alpha-galactosidase n=1 Tax=unclassified Parabacteroides TaxID=2649774 RepID=UPI0013D49FE9|nr:MULTISPECIES: alpha-galactosidase [unclassified Parabacteroides]MDH6535669.1 alpha-galactosidase [Parabacteroides sp. PM5-20]NDV56268.1 alpha-galactosidase [Parabacteroides sp. 52]